MIFADDIHKQFFKRKYQELKNLGKEDIYYKSIIYALSICDTTREHFEDIFDLKNGEINIDSLNAPYQTGTSLKVTRLAFNLWNDCCYDNEEDSIQNKVSKKYSPSELFCCTYAPYFYQAIMIRYSEYSSY